MSNVMPVNDHEEGVLIAIPVTWMKPSKKLAPAIIISVLMSLAVGMTIGGLLGYAFGVQKANDARHRTEAMKAVENPEKWLRGQ